MKHGLCRNETLYIAGDRPQIVATVRPADVADAMTLWRKDGEHPWERVTSVPVDENGRAAWRWETSDADIRNAPWSYRYTIPDVGSSDVVRIRIIAPDF
jgi:hypothetical protein